MTALARDEPLTPHIGAQLVSELGFLHVPGPPLSANRAYLFAALRPRPTLRHFDPERIDFWQASGGRGLVTCLDWRSRPPADTEFEWGAIRLVDRLGMVNDFVGFGGRLAVTRSPSEMVAVFSSPAPILSRGGHSQGWDPGADEVATYLARLRAAAGSSRQLEVRLAAMPPEAVYASFVASTLVRHQNVERLAGWHPTTLALHRRERGRLRRQAPAVWAMGEELARDLRS